jgi:hypothetical protein
MVPWKVWNLTYTSGVEMRARGAMASCAPRRLCAVNLRWGAGVYVSTFAQL